MASPAEGHPALIEDYFRWIETLVANASTVRFFNITYDKRSTYIGFIRGSIYFLDGSPLHLREFVSMLSTAASATCTLITTSAQTVPWSFTTITPALPSPAYFLLITNTRVVKLMVTTGPVDLETVLAEIRGRRHSQAP